jgi:hypothetical protein
MSTLIVTLALCASACIVFVLVEMCGTVPWLHRQRDNPMMKLVATWTTLVVFVLIAIRVTESAALFAIVLR